MVEKVRASPLLETTYTCCIAFWSTEDSDSGKEICFPAWLVNVKAEIMSFHALCLNIMSINTISVLVWFRLKAWVSSWEYRSSCGWGWKKDWSEARGHLRSPAAEVSHRLGPPRAAEPGVGLDGATVSAEFCWLDTAKLLDLAEDEASLLGFPPPSNSTVTLAPIWIPLGAWPTRPTASRARDYGWSQDRALEALPQLASFYCLGHTSASIWDIRTITQFLLFLFVTKTQKVLNIQNEMFLKASCFCWKKVS